MAKPGAPIIEAPVYVDPDTGAADSSVLGTQTAPVVSLGVPNIARPGTGSSLNVFVQTSMNDDDLPSKKDPGPSTDYIKSWEARLYGAGATLTMINQGAAGSYLRGAVTYKTKPPPYVRRVFGTVFPSDYTSDVGVPLQMTVRHVDKDGNTGKWSALRWVVADVVPWIYTDPTKNGAVSFDHASQTPDVTVTLFTNALLRKVTLGQIRVVIQTQRSDGTWRNLTDTWSTWSAGGRTGTVTGSSLNLPGSGLDYGTRYRMFVQVANNWGTRSVDPTGAGTGSGQSTWIYWTPQQTSGPTHVVPTGSSSAPSQSFVHKSRRPSFTIGHSANWDHYRWRWNDAISDDGLDLAGNLLFDGPSVAASPALTSGNYDATGIQYPAAGSTNNPVTLGWGSTVYFQVQVQLAGTDTWTAWSQPYPARINALPSAPIVTTKRTYGDQQLLDPVAVFATESRSPICTFKIDDADGDWIRYRNVRVFDSTGATQLWKILRRGYALGDIKQTVPIDSLAGIFDSPAQDGQPWTYATAALGWVAGAGTHALTYDNTAGMFVYGVDALKVAITAQPLSTTVVDLGPDLWRNIGSGAFSDFSATGGFKVNVRLDGTITNLSSLRIRVHCLGVDSNYREYQVATSATATGAFASTFKAWGSQTASGGSWDATQIHRISIVTITGAGGTLTCSVHVDSLSLTDGSGNQILVAGTTYMLRSAAVDDTTENVFGSTTSVLFKASTIPTAAWGTAPDGTDPTPAVPYTYNGAVDQATRELEIWRRRGLYDLMAKRPGAVLFWPMDEASGTTANDQSGNARNGTYTGTVLANAGITGDGRTVAEMDTNGDKAAIADAAALRPASFSWFGLLRLASLADTVYLVRKVDSGNGSWYLKTGSAGATHRRLMLEFQTSAGVYQTLGSWPADGTDPTLNQWVFVGFSFDNATKNTRFWVGKVGVDADVVQYNAAGAITTSPVVANAAPFSSAPGNLEVGAVGGTLTVRNAMFEMLNRASDGTEASALYAEVVNGTVDEQVYDDLEDDDEPTGTLVTIAVPGKVMADDATFWPRLTVTDADGLVQVLV